MMESIAQAPVHRSNEGQRFRLELAGMLQGVGFRPHVYRLAVKHELTGWVRNTRQGVEIEVEGKPDRLNEFMEEVLRPFSDLVQINLKTVKRLHATGTDGFKILKSCEDGEWKLSLLPDLATCRECLDEIRNPANRRFRYPFTNCTQCGPRFTIVETLPYDRQRTSMSAFAMCAACRREYENPVDRRFHAQPIACPDCGPQLQLWDACGTAIATKEEALGRALELLRRGHILAVKGVGGFHLMANAGSEQTVQTLRKRKRRPAKPLALMFPSIESVRDYTEVNADEERLLRSPAGPIVLLKRKTQTENRGIADSVAPGNPWLGSMLPSNPLHYLLIADFGGPLIATSGNVSEEPLCQNEQEAIERLKGIADFYLIHDRPIVQPADDSIVRVICGQEQMLRRARGYTPLPVVAKTTGSAILGLGGQLKSTLALSGENGVFVSQHLGDMENAEVYTTFERTLESLRNTQGGKIEYTVCDQHPDYKTTMLAERLQTPVIRIQHHMAHVFSCAGEHGLDLPVLGVAWDGSGYGIDGTLWGGEFFRITRDRLQRFATLKSFPLPGGAQALREPRRSALGLLYQRFGEACFAMPEARQMFTRQELTVLRGLLTAGVNCPQTSSCGRLFDAVSALAGIRLKNEFEGHAAMDLEFSAMGHAHEHIYPVEITDNTNEPVGTADPDQNADSADQWAPCHIIEWSSMLDGIIKDVRNVRPPSEVARKFHNTLSELIVRVSIRAGIPQVVLTGGCFQNRLLTEETVAGLRQGGLTPFWHQRVPPNDGGLSLGQVLAAQWYLSRRKP